MHSKRKELKERCKTHDKYEGRQQRTEGADDMKGVR